MPQLKYFFFTVVLVFASCISGGTNKVTSEAPLSIHNVLGNWELSQTKISPGGPVEWSMAENKNTYRFELDGSYIYLDNGNEERSHLGTYNVKDNELQLTHTAGGEEAKTATYRMTLSNSELILDFVGCSEECRLKYKRIAE